jgi:HK97 family phage major capsid protein
MVATYLTTYWGGIVTATELRNQRAELLAEARKITSKETESCPLSAEDKERVEGYIGQIDALAVQLERAERSERLDKYEHEMRQVEPRKVQPATTSARGQVTDGQRKEAFRNWCLRGTVQGANIGPDAHYRAADCGVNLNSPELELRAMSKGTNSAGGFGVPTDFTAEYEKYLAYYFPLGNALSSFTTSDGRDLPYTRFSDTGNAAAIVAEAGSIGYATDPTLSQVTFKAWKYVTSLKVSTELLQDSVVDLEQYFGEAFAERFARGYEAAVISSNAGSAAPEGLLTGLSVGTTLATGNPITLAKLISMETSVDIAYRSLPGAGWIMADGTWAAIRQLADTAGMPILQTDIQSGVAPRLLGYPVHISNTLTSHASPGDNAVLAVFGALSKYRQRFCSNRTLIRQNELFAANGQVGFVMAERYDGRHIGPVGASGSMKTLNSFDSP